MCEGPCPGCIFKDFSCYGSNCEADYLDPDMHWTYCANCSLNWSGSQCCGDDEKEYWVPPCPNSSVWGCCSNENERISRDGKCVISCGTSIKANANALDERLVSLTVSLNPEVINVEAGKSAEFEVVVRTDGNQSLHNLMLNLCGSFIFESSPQSIEELKPGEARNFTVKVRAAPDSAIGTLGIAAYVSSSELIRQRYKPGFVIVNAAGLQLYDVFIWMIPALAAVYVAKKLLSRRKGASHERTGMEKAGKKPDKGAARRKLAELVREELAKGTSEKKLRQVLASNGISSREIEAAFRDARSKG